MADPVIEIREGQAGFVVAIEPPAPAHPEQIFSDHRKASGHA